MPLALIAFLWGSFSAVSLPLGASLGLALKPGKRVTSTLMAFGAGALLFALTIELFGAALHHAKEHGRGLVVVTMIGAVIGGLLFDLLNQALNNRGAFLRGISNTKSHVMRIKRGRINLLMSQLSKIELLQNLPPEEIAQLATLIRPDNHRAGEVIFNEGDVGTAFYFIQQGKVALTHNNHGEEETLLELGDGHTFGEIALLTHGLRKATVVTLEDSSLYKLTNHDFEFLISHSPKLQLAINNLGQQRIHHLAEKSQGDVDDDWLASSTEILDRLPISISDQEINRVVKDPAQNGAFFAIWLGILLDGIPESLVIGMLAASDSGMSLAFIAGVFMANLPEAMSSAVGMRRSGMSKTKIVALWGSLTIMTGVGAAIGVYLFPPHATGAVAFWVAGIEGLAAGAMLTMIAETMLPEAFEQGGSIIGFATLAGFLASLSIKII